MSAIPEGAGVVVLTHGGGGEHEPLLAALLRDRGSDTPIVLVHNPSEPGEPAPAAPPWVEVVQADRNLGYAAGMNFGISRLPAAGRLRYLLLLTHDVRLPEGCLASLFAAAEAHGEFGVLAPALRDSGSGDVFSYGGLSSPTGRTEHRRARPEPSAGGIAPCAWVDGGMILFRSEVIDRVGTYDERFWGYCEESELCLRARRAGWRVGVLVDVFAEQAPGGPGRLGMWSYLLTRNGAEYARRAAGPRGAAAALARAAGVVAFNLVRVPLRLVRRRPGGPREPWLIAVGAARGAADFLRRRFGPPPASLPGMGDVRNL